MGIRRREDLERDGGEGGPEPEQLTEAELLTIVANLRGSNELDVANEYTTTQLHHIAATYLRDKLFVMTTILRGLGGGKKTKAGKKGGVPSWYSMPKRKGGVGVVDLDGPMDSIRPFVGGFGGAVGAAKAPGMLPWTSKKVPTGVNPDGWSPERGAAAGRKAPAGRTARQAAVAAARRKKG